MPNAPVYRENKSPVRSSQLRVPLRSGMILKNIEGYALFSRFSKKCSRCWTFPCTAKIFHRWDPLTLVYFWYQVEGNRRVHAFPEIKKCSWCRTNACIAEIFHMWDPLTLGYLWCEFEGNRRVRECVFECVYECVFIVMDVVPGHYTIQIRMKCKRLCTVLCIKKK